MIDLLRICRHSTDEATLPTTRTQIFDANGLAFPMIDARLADRRLAPDTQGHADHRDRSPLNVAMEELWCSEAAPTVSWRRSSHSRLASVAVARILDVRMEGRCGECHFRLVPVVPLDEEEHGSNSSAALPPDVGGNPVGNSTANALHDIPRFVPAILCLGAGTQVPKVFGLPGTPGTSDQYKLEAARADSSSS
jgi:hypothetical protein